MNPQTKINPSLERRRFWRTFGLLALIAATAALVAGAGFGGLGLWKSGIILLLTWALMFWVLKIFADPQRDLISKVRKIVQADANVPVENLNTRLQEFARSVGLQREAEVLQREEQSALMGAISDAVLAVDAQETVLLSNSRFAVVFRERGGGAGRKLWEVFREPVLLDAFRKVLQGQGRQELIFSMETDGGRGFMSLAVAPLKRGDSLFGAIGIFHDVTELKRAEQIRIDFVANVSHELRTPLTVIAGYAETLLQDVTANRMPERSHVENVQRNAKRLMSLIGDLLDLSSLESTDTLQKIAIDLREFTERVVAGYRSLIEAKGQTLELSFQVPTLSADPKRLEQVLVNLIENAHKYSPKGARINVAWAPSGDFVDLTVSDTGPGIAEEHLSRLFERFYRVDKGRSRDAGGTGLGLAIVKHIVQRHGGSVRAESAIGQGTRFICRFPAI